MNYNDIRKKFGLDNATAVTAPKVDTAPKAETGYAAVRKKFGLEQSNPQNLTAPLVSSKRDYDADIFKTDSEIKRLQEQYDRIYNGDVNVHALESWYTDYSTSAPSTRIDPEQDAANLKLYNELRGEFDSFADIQRRIEELKAEKWKLENEKKYSAVSANADFAEKSKVTQTEATSNVFDGLLKNSKSHYDIINGLLKIDKADALKKSGNPFVTGYADYISDNLHYMKDEEKKVYNYLYNTQGADSAEEYLDYLKGELGGRAAKYSAKEWEELAHEFPAQTSIMSVPMNLWSGVGYVDVALQKAANDAKEAATGEYAGPVHYNTFGTRLSKNTSAIRGTVAQDLVDQYGAIDLDEEKHPVLSKVLNGKSWGDVYQLGMSMADSATVAAVSPVLGTAGTMLLAGSAATSTMLDAVEKGATDEQALAMGALSGAFEYIFEKYELENLLGADTNILKAVTNQALTEAVGEGATGIANFAADTFVMAEKSDWQQNVQKYMTENPGMSEAEARKLAFADAAIQIGWDAVGGLLSGGMMGGSSSAIKGISSRVDQTERVGQHTTQSGENAQAELTRISMTDFANTESPVWRNVEYDDTNTRNSIMQETHNAMVAEGAVLKVADDVAEQVEQSYPDLRDMKKKDRTPILKSAMAKLKNDLRGFLNSFKNQSFEFEVNGNILDAKLYNTGISEVLEKITKEKAEMLYSTEDIFRNARYLYSTPDYDGNPNVYRWNYFYTPIEIGGETVGVRIAVRDVIEGQDHQPESQIYNWGIKKDTSLGGVQPVVSDSSHDASSDVSNNIISKSGVGVNSESTQTDAKPGSLEWAQELMELGRSKGNTQEGAPSAPKTAVEQLVRQQTTVDTATQAGYDNRNDQGGVVNGTQRTAQVYDERGTATDTFGSQEGARPAHADRSSIQSALGEANVGFKETVSYGESTGLNTPRIQFQPDDYVAPVEGSPLDDVQKQFLQDYGITCNIIKDSAWTRKNPAFIYRGTVYIKESIDVEDLSTAVPHESTHSMAQSNFVPYSDFLNKTSDSVNIHSTTGQRLLLMAAEHCKIDLFSMNNAQERKLYGEVNAIVYGMYKSGVLANSQYGYDWIPNAFLDFNSYITELDSIHNQYRRQAKTKTQTTDSVGAAPGWFDVNTRLQYEYGTIPDGENPVRSDDLPKRDYVGNPVSQTARTVKGAAVTPDSFIDLLNKDTAEGGMSYVKITNDATVQKAIKHITQEGWEAAKAQWHADVRNGKAGADLTATGALLLNNAAKAGDKAAWLNILHDYQRLGTNTAQGLQALRILKQLTPSDKLYMAKRSVEQMVKDMKLDTDVTIDPELEAEYNEATTDAERDAVIKKIQKNVAQQLPTTFMEKFTALRYVNMLGNLRTQGRNIVGNLTMKGTRTIHNTVAAGIEAVVNKVSGGKTGRTRSVTVSKEQKAAAAKDFDTLKDNILDGGKYNDTMTATGFARGVQEQKQIFKSKLWEGYRKVTNWAMEQGDIIFAKDAYARALAGYLKANGITETDYSKVDTAIMDDARLFAAKEAQEATFRDTNWLSGWVSKIGRRKDTPAVGKLLSEGIMPFRKTPANVLVRAEEYSPLGIVNSVVMSVQAAQKDSNITANQVINSWAKTLTGTGLFGVGMLLHSLGLLSAGPDDDEKKEGFEDLNGWQDYALTLPDGTNLTIDCFSPSAIPVLMGAQLMKEIGENGFQLKDIGSALTSIADPMVEMSMLQGVNDALENIQYSDSTLGQLVINAAVSYLTQGLTNTLAGQLERSFEDTRMQTYVDKDSDLPAWLQRTLGKASAKTPVWDYNQIPYINAWGEEEKNPPTGLNLVYNLLSPSYFDKGKDDEVTRELNRLNDAQDENVYPSIPDKSMQIDKQQYNLSAEEYVELAKLQGQTQKKIVENLVANKDYQRLSDKDKAKAIRYAYDYARDKSRGEVVEEHPGLTTKWMQQIADDPAEGIIRHIASDGKYTFLSVSDASYVDDLLKGLAVETGRTNVRDIQKIEAVAGADSQLSAKEQQQVMEDILGDSAYEKYLRILDLGMDNDDYAVSYRLYLDAEGGKGKKARIISQFQNKLDVSNGVAEKLYDIYTGKK